MATSNPGAPGSRPATAADLDGTTFVLEKVVEGDTEHPVVDTNPETTVRFTDGGGMQVTGDCNGTIAQYSLDREGDLTITEPRGARYGCEAASADQGARLDQVTSNGANVSVVDGGAIDLRKGDVAIRMRPR